MYENMYLNVDFKKIARKSKYDMEREATHDFLASENKNVCFEYKNSIDARNAYQAMWVYAKQARQPICVHQRLNRIILTRNNEE